MAENEDKLYREQLPNVLTVIKNGSRKCCQISTLKGFFPILTWLPQYSWQLLIPDIVAGITVGLTAIPQAIAYAAIAGLATQYGLYSAFMGCFVYMIFGTSKDVTVGPTAIMSLMVQTHVTGSPEYAVLLCFLAGCIILVLGLLNLGVAVRFISVPVVTGFTTAAAITIGSGQINNLFGIKSPSNEFVDSWEHFFTHLKDTKRNDAILGVITLVILLLMRKVKDIPLSCKKILQYISLSRNALAVMVGILICYLLSKDDDLPFKVSGEISAGLPDFKPPPFSVQENGTTVADFGQMISELGGSLISIPLIAILECVAIAKAFSQGKIVNASQEMVALGISNIMGSFVSSMPITGSFTRSAINNSSGVKTPFGGVFTGTLVLLALAFLTRTFYYIPKATLAAIIISAMIFMVEYERIGEIWKSKKLDMIPLLVTLFVCLFWSLEYGMICGSLINALFILFKSATPEVVISKDKINSLQIALVEIKDNVWYSSAEFLKTHILEYVNSSDKIIKFVVLQANEIKNLDCTVALNILSLKADLALLDCKLICWNWNMNAAGVICRLNPKERHIFKFGKSLHEIIAAEVTNESSNGDALEEQV